MSRADEASGSDFASSSDEEGQQVRATRRAFVVCEVFPTLEEAQIGIDVLDGFHYKYKHNYGNAGNGGRRSPDESGAQFVLEETDMHGDEDQDIQRRGIHGALKREIDSILFGGAGPKKCRKLLLDRHGDNPVMLQHLPTESQLKNRKAGLRKKQSGGWEIHNFATLLEWAYTHLCTSKSDFFGHEDDISAADAATQFANKSRQFQHGVIVLECFEHDFIDQDGKAVKSFGLILTSRHMLLNIPKAYECQQDIGVLGATDGTYKLHFGGWTLVDFGTYTTHYSRKQYSKTFVPWMYMFVKTEHQTAYATLFRTAKHFARLFFGVDLALAYGSLDRTQGIANAFKEVWPDVILLNCYPHLVRKSREKIKLLKDPAFYEDNVLPDIRYLSKARSAKQFKALSKLFLEFWIQQNERDYAKWFEDIYLGDTWGNWFYVAAAAGITPSQNALEAHHRVIKKVCVGTLRASTSVVLNDSIPSILGLQESEPARPALSHFSEGPFMSGVVARAQTLVQEKSNHYMIKDTGEFVVSPKNIHSAVLNRDRATIYRNSINGKLPPGMTRKRVGPPTEGGDNTHRFSVDVLIREFLKYPARPLHWNLMKESKIPDDSGSEVEQFLLGKGISWGETNDVFFWMTKFSNGAQVKLECQELAECLTRAYTHGADVAGAVAY
ncbi:hypothetical protein PHYSODRAFT_335356 [Phytophthora sojae]|uniref:MULE transposase domain-containing protein n=1 Tax=Phytophthora sojae (strain P6497) TaxID=1094619 RepID=G4ZUX2_PHYSP|nr:hypothetical protein PHYSODRAFT_335356 [Phytophthora sojae]EGZ13596.1 hypothetical protein PHYSODRAFT_335356 [Phytophthora sojae]|eukprot:XP_009531025.1 hypothetical protein PHYSODRAFT_335356 [Phytophthora sojae]